MPEPLVRGDEAFDALAPVSIGVGRAARDHAFEDNQKLFRDFVIILIAGVMKRDQDFVREPAAVPDLGFVGLAGLFCELVDGILVDHVSFQSKDELDVILLVS